MRIDLRLILAIAKAYRGRSILLGLVIVAVAYAALETISIPTFQHGLSIHVWTLAPATAAGVISVGVDSQLSGLDWVAGTRRWRLRICWVVLALVAVVLAALPASLEIHRPSMISASLFLAAATFGLSSIRSGWCWVLSAANVLLALFLPGHFVLTDPVTNLVIGWPVIAIVVGMGSMGVWIAIGSTERWRLTRGREARR